MARSHRLFGTVATALLVMSSPLAAHADPKPITPVRPTPTDTAVRNESKRTTPASAKKKAIKAKPSASPSTGPEARQYVPDQPWETEFFVDNYIPTSQRRTSALTLASARLPR